MKFKSILLFFQIVLAVGFFLVFFLPLPVLGWEWTLGYWTRHWYWALLFALVLGGAWYQIQKQTRYLGFLEDEDWKGLTETLEDKFRRLKKLSPAEARLWVHASFLAQRVADVPRIESALKEKQPGLAERMGLLFALPGWLGQDMEGTHARLENCLKQPRLDDRPWVVWALGFLKLNRGKSREGAEYLRKLIGRSDHLGFLSAYLFVRAQPGSPLAAVLKKRWAKVPVDRLRKRAEKMKETQLLAVFLDGLMDDAVAWVKGEDHAG